MTNDILKCGKTSANKTFQGHINEAIRGQALLTNKIIMWLANIEGQSLFGWSHVLSEIFIIRTCAYKSTLTRESILGGAMVQDISPKFSIVHLLQ